MKKDFLVVDFEYTTYDKYAGSRSGFFSEIIETGAVRLDGESLKVKGGYKSFVRPELCPEHARKAMEFCMISIADMEKAVSFKKMTGELAKLYDEGGTRFVTWGMCDFPVLDKACRKYGVRNPIAEDDVLDLAEAYRIYKGCEKTVSLKNAAEEEGVRDGLWHAAYDDAVNTGRILEKMIKDGWTVEEFEAERAEILKKRKARKAAKRAKYMERVEPKRQCRNVIIPDYSGFSGQQVVRVR